ncbi:MAG: peroxiredoxin [Acidiphilium sp. 37-64-53]|uniref:OsmC family protein n=1 Tax=Acidiphilium TaxID=522 RepID=UPI000BCCAC6B|nr:MULTISPECIES: OsmC family protein [Acidiphilium]OYW03909.1 MAG: peroxiredoxin [Acidiphilium sp. 37-64-53]OZB29626.1 MAG: peroxiredoxin [Acidiphilium sp. 34-64-41]HQT83840.1 OsmC family protein [Acidiphilium rubrum]
MSRAHQYRTRLRWTGNAGSGTSAYRAYGRDHAVGAAGRPDLLLSSDPAFRGDPARWNPELLLLAAISSCHQLWYLHLCAEAGVVVLNYQDDAEAILTEEASGAGQFTAVTLRPRVTIAAASDAAAALRLHHDANAMCFIARSLNLPVHHEPSIVRADAAAIHETLTSRI